MSSSPQQQAQSVPLPARIHNPTKAHQPPVWPLAGINSTEQGASAEPLELPLSAKCARTDRTDGICCRELIVDERRLIDPDVVRDIVIGLSDGLTVPFALTAGLSSLGESKFVVLAGLAELMAGAISMGIGGFLASQSEQDHYRYLRKQTRLRVERSCEGEMEREVAEVLAPIGVDEKVCRAVARSLQEAEDPHHGAEANVHVPDPERPALRWSNNVGLTAFLLKFGQGLEEIPDRRLYTSAFTIGMGYLVGGLIPLLPYFFIPHAQTALVYSVIVTGVVLLVFGAIKAHVTGAGIGTYSYVWGALSTLLVGGVAAGAAFGIVRALEAHE